MASRVALFIISVLFLGVSSVGATSSFTSTLSPSKSSVRVGETFTVAITLSGLDSDGLGSANYDVGFNDNLFTYVSVSGSGVIKNLVGSTVKLGFADGTGGEAPKQNGTFASLTFTAKSTASTASGAFSLTSAGTKNKNGDNITSINLGTSVGIFVPRTDAYLTSLSLSSGSLNPAFSTDTTSYTATIDAPSVSINATAVEGATIAGTGSKSLNYGDNSFNIIVTAEDGTTQKNYSLKITRPDNRNTDSKLKSLTIRSYNLSFDPATTNYSVTLPSNIDTFFVTGEVNNSKSSIVYYPNQSINLDYGQAATIAITVTAENGGQTIYRVTATRKDDRSTNNDLKELSVSDTDIRFNGGVSYTDTVENNITSVNISATASDSKSTVAGIGRQELREGSNVFRVTVTAENGSQKIYTITIIRNAKNGVSLNLSIVNTLKSLTIENVSLNFSADKTIYNISVENNVTDLKVNYELTNNKSSAVIEGKTTLKVGSNLIKIIVTAENGDSKIYFLYVERRIARTVIENDENTITGEISNKTGDPDIYIIVNLSDANKTISTEVLKALSESNKRLIYEVVNDSNGTIYSITIDGSKMDNYNNPLNFNITFKSDYQPILQGLVKDKKYLPINIKHNGKLPVGTIIKIFIADKFNTSEKPLHLYYFNTKTNSLELIQEKVQVIDGYVNLQLDHASEYILSDNALKISEGYPFWTITLIGIVVGLTIICSIIAIVVIKKNKTSHNQDIKLPTSINGGV